MESFFSRYKNALVLIIVLLAQVVGVAIQVRRPLPKEHAQPDAGGVRLIRYWAISLVSPPERFVHWLGESILGVWDNYVDLIHVRQQNKDLQGEIRRLRIEQGGIVEDARQGQRLQQLLSFEEKYIYKTVPAQIIGSSGAEQSRILSINKGAKDGIAVDMPVITPDGIVGRIREVFPHTSQVLEITDPASGAGVMLATTRIRGILRGNAVGQPQVVNVLPDDRIKAGEQVVTSGGDQIFPRGLAVGTVDRVMVDPDRDPLVDVLIHPAANLSRLEEVLVITDMENSATPRQKLDMLQSAAAASAEQLKASEILAERLPSRIDPDAPPDAKENDSGGEETASATGGDPGRPLRPLLAVHPDRFSPNTTPAAMSLTPGARLAPQSEGTVRITPRPRPAAAPADGNLPSSEAPVKKKAPELVPDDGSRPAAAAIARPRPPAESSPAVPRAPGTASGTPTAHSAANPGTGAASPARLPGTSGGAGATATPHIPAIHPANHPETGAEAVPRTPSGTAPVAGNHTATVEEANPSGTVPAPKTHVVVDGPLPSTARKPATPSTAAQQHPSAAAGQRPAVNARPGTTTPGKATSGTTTPRTGPGTGPATTGTRPAATPQHKGPELVPDDGSRPPPTMLHPSQPKPQPRPANPAPQQQAQPQGGR